MSEIEELQQRILSAMDRVAQGVDALGGAETGALEALRDELSAEKASNAELNERVNALGKRQEEVIATIEAKARERLADLDSQLQKLRQANGQLAQACEALRDANAEGVGDPHLINKAMQAELEAIKSMRAAEMAEATEIIETLMPLLQNAGPAETAGGTA